MKKRKPPSHIFKLFIVYNNTDFLLSVHKTVHIKNNLISDFNKHLILHHKSFTETFNVSHFLDIVKDNTNVPFWNDKIRKKSQGLFLPHKHTMEIEDNNFTKKTWFKFEFYKEKMPCFHLEELNHYPKNDITEITKSKNIKLYLTPEQSKILKQFIGAYRYFYNRTINVLNNYNKNIRETHYTIKENETNKDINISVPIDKNVYNFYYLRSILKENIPIWVTDIKFQSHLIDLAINEAVIKVTTNMNKKRKFIMKMKTKKDLKQTINLEKTMITDKGFFSGLKLNGSYIFRDVKMSENISKLNYGGSTITYHRILNTFTMNLTYKTISVKNTSNKICSIDPGIRDFMVLFSDTKVCKIGVESTDKLYKKCREVDKIDSKMNSKEYYVNEKKYIVNSKRKRQLNEAKHRKITEIKNMKKELHDQTINYICKNYSKVIIPPFEIQEMVSKLQSKTARCMYTLSFNEFKEKLKNKGKERNCEIIIKPEYYTSKTCTRCGNIKKDLKMTDKIYSCKKCGLEIDRNYAGARNIMLRNN